MALKAEPWAMVAARGRGLGTWSQVLCPEVWDDSAPSSWSYIAPSGAMER